MKPEDSLEAGLHALAEADRGQNAPAHIEAVLVKAFQARHGKAEARWWIWGAAAAAAAAMILVAVTLRAPRAPRKEQAAPVVARVETSRPARAPAADQGVRPTKARKAVRRAPRKQATPAREEVVTSFIPLQPGDDMESGQVVRVMLPRTALVTFGLPMNPERALEPVKADVVFGQDGVARAIRFVQ